MKTQDIAMIQGETVTIMVDVTDGTGAAMPLTGYDVRYEAETSPPIVKDIDAGDIALASGGWRFTFVIQPEDTKDLLIAGTERFAHECRIESPDGENTVIFRGRLSITQWVIDDMDGV